MQGDEARALLMRRMGVDGNDVTAEVWQLFDAVADRVGCLALAVDMAGAVLAEEVGRTRNPRGDPVSPGTVQTTLKQYLDDFDAHRDDLLIRERRDELSEYQKTVWTVWNTSIDAVRKAGRSLALECLILMACLPGGSSQRELFRLASMGWNKMIGCLAVGKSVAVPEWLKTMLHVRDGRWDDFHYREAVKVLERYVLVQQTDKAWSETEQRKDQTWPGTRMHSMIQWRAKKLGEKQGLGWDRWVWLMMVAAAVETNDSKGRPQFRRHLAAGLQALVSSCECPEESTDTFDDVALACGEIEIAEVLYEEGLWSAAAVLFSQAVKTRKSMLGEQHPATLTSMAYLASTYRKQGRWKEAEELELQVAEIRKMVLGGEHLDTLSSMGNLASTYRFQGRFKEAEELEVQVMEIRKRVLGEEHPDTLTSMANLAETYWNHGRWEKAKGLAVQVMETRQRVLGEEHPDLLTTMISLAAKPETPWPIQ